MQVEKVMGPFTVRLCLWQMEPLGWWLLEDNCWGLPRGHPQVESRMREIQPRPSMAASTCMAEKGSELRHSLAHSPRSGVVG